MDAECKMQLGVVVLLFLVKQESEDSSVGRNLNWETTPEWFTQLLHAQDSYQEYIEYFWWSGYVGTKNKQAETIGVVCPSAQGGRALTFLSTTPLFMDGWTLCAKWVEAIPALH